MNKTRFLSPALATACFCAGSFLLPSATAAVITDPANDFLSTYTGPQGGDLDVLTAEAVYNGSTFQFSSTSNGNIGLTAGGFFVWGIDRGAGTARFGAFASGVLFDSVLILTPGGTSTFRDLIANTAVNLDPSAVSFSGATLSATIDASFLTSQGFAKQNYTVNLWPRLSGGNNLIADFAPDNSNAQVTSTTPEPASIALLGGALLPLLFALRRRAAR